jgi:hypothetical protein
MIGCESDSSFFLTSRPEMYYQVDIPVIYVHSENRVPFTAKVTFDNGRPTDTYPEAAIATASATWANVGYADSLLAQLQITDDLVPLEQIIPVLNDVDANILEYKGATSRFLFYEGDAGFSNQVDVFYDLDSQSVTFTNYADYPVYDLLLVVVSGIWWPVMVYGVQLDLLAAGQTVSLPLPNRMPSCRLAEQLVELGFSESEAESFGEIWCEAVLAPPGFGENANLLYRLPQSEYDRLINLEITPQPVKIVRALYVLIHLQTETPPRAD